MATPSSLPEHLGPYRILERIGSGGMAEVHLARRFGASGWEKRVALKVLRAEHRGQAEFERLLIGEARLGARFAHPGLIQIHEFGLADGIYYACMDYVDGADLASLIALRPLPRPLVLYIGEQVATALAHVHQMSDEAGRPLGLVHRDVSPGNILISRNGEVKLSDFGIAKATAEDDRTWGRLRKGKYAYMAPEQVRGEPLTGAVDIFALGVTLHECLLGWRPFDGAGPLETMERLREAELEDDHDYGDLELETVSLLSRALAKDTHERFAGDAARLARALQGARRNQRPVGALDLADWVEKVLERAGVSTEPPAAALETLGMDE